VLLLLDFDGTITERDTLDLLAQEYAPAAFAEAEERLQSGEWTLNQVIRHEFEAVRADEAEVLAFLREHVTLRPGLAELIDLCRERFVEAVVVSAGFHEVIEPVLAWNGVALPVVAHHATFTRDGAIVSFRERPVCEHCGEECKRAVLPSLARGRLVAYVGDGWSDRCGARSADLVFARAGLADHLAAEGVPYTPFDDLYDVRAGLAAFLSPA
jgi:HAD superfamily phosphoserine phosphatase-like hydrolase